MEKQNKLVLVPCPYQGHINPMLQLGKALHSKGFSITIVHTLLNSPKPNPDFSFVALPDGLPSGNASVITDPVGTILTLNKTCRAPFGACLRHVIQGGVAVTCVISDEIMFFAEDVAIEMGLRSLILRTTSAATSLARSGLVSLNDQGCLLRRDTLSKEIVPGLDPLRFKDMPFILAYNFEKFSTIVAKMYGERRSSAIIWNTINFLEHSILEQIQIKCQAPLFPIGPLHMIASPISSSLIEEDKTCLLWLNKQLENSVIYVSCLGSLGILSEKELAEIAWGLANSGQPFLWVIRPGSVSESDWIGLLPNGFLSAVGERGCIVKWAPQKEVLAHSAVGGFWSHCGWNSTLETLAEGVPLICKPCFSDQKVNARYASHVWRVGLELEELERGEIERAIRRLILTDEGHEMRSRAKTFKEKIKVSTSKGGSSHDSFDELVNFILSH